MKFPYFASGPVVKGFGRGSKQLGVPTANFPHEIVDELPIEFKEGVYYGWAQVDEGQIYKMVLSVGNNPYFNNEKRTMETYIMHKFEDDFYGANLKVLITGWIREMRNYSSLDELIEAIHKDIDDADRALDLEMRKNTFNREQYFKVAKI